MTPPRVYVDYNATAPVRPEVRAAIEPLLFGDPVGGHFGNASSIHWAGQSARKVLERARSEIAQRTLRKPSEVIFTSGGSEADNLALFGVLGSRIQPKRLLVSAVEHPAVLSAASRLRDLGVEVVTIAVDDRGQLDLDRLDRELRTKTTLVSVMAVNNETGIISPIDEVIRLAHAHGALVHVDAVQAAGRIALPSADLVTLSGHKIGALKGCGVLLTRDSVPLAGQIVGGPQERGHRAGTEPVFLAAAFATAFALTLDSAERETVRLAAMRNRVDRVVASLPGARVLGETSPRVANTTTVLLSDVDGDSVLQALDLEGVAASSGSACSSGSLEPSHVLLAMGVPRNEALAAIRFSLGWATTDEDIDRVVESLPKVVAAVRSST